MQLDRAAGVILHPTSLPGPYGIGDLGPEAHRWVDWLASSGCGLWQVLPLNPTGYGDSPYQAFSAVAGNPYLISPDLLAGDGLLAAAELEAVPAFPTDRVDYGAVIPWKVGLLDRAYQRLPESGLRPDFDAFVAAEASWLHDFAMFMALKDAHGGGAWTGWPPPLRDREPPALAAACAEHAELIERHAFRQFLFFRQWQALRARVTGYGIRVVGDAPIFVAHDSADVWAHRELFHVAPDGSPTVVAGVPPDYFSTTGQLWGNPLYDWEAHAATGYAWWIARLRTTLRQVDLLRIDHFRAFADYWEIPAGAETAVHGRWVNGPGKAFFDAVEEALGEVPIIAEDLGELSAAVPELLQAVELPGMRIFQFAFDGKPEFFPHVYPEQCVAYTGTHDNDTVLGWFRNTSPAQRAEALEYLGSDGADFAGDMIRRLWASAAAFVLAPIQDFLRLGNEARMNLPGRSGGNWAWRLAPGSPPAELAAEIRELNEATGRARER